MNRVYVPGMGRRTAWTSRPAAPPPLAPPPSGTPAPRDPDCEQPCPCPPSTWRVRDYECAVVANPLAVVQAVAGGAQAVYGGLALGVLVESSWINSYAFLITYALIVGILGCVLQAIALIYYAHAHGAALSARQLGGVGLPLIIQLIVAVNSIVVLTGWLGRFGDGCCERSDGRPDVRNAEQLTQFYSAYSVIAAGAVATVSAYIGALFLHVRPEAAVDG